MKVGTINSKFVSTDIRLSAGYFLNDDAVNSRIIERNYANCKELGEMATVWNPPIFKRQFCENTERAVPYCQSSDVTNALEGSEVFINKAQAYKVGSVVEDKQILVTGFGTIGNTRLVNELSHGSSFANNVCRIEVKDEVLYGFIYAFMTSKYGKSQLNKNASGSVVRYIEAPGIKKTLIPILPEETQQKIHSLIVESAQLRVEANKLLKEAVEIFEKENEILKNINSDDFLFDISENKKEIGRKVKVSDKFKITFKARNFSMRAEKIAKIYEEKNGIRLGNFVEKPFEMGARASFKRIDNENFKGTDLISQGDIHKQNPKIFKQVKIKKSGEIDYASKATVILPSAGTLGENEIFTRPLLIRNNFEGKLLSEVIGKFICRTEIDAAYLYIFLKYPLTFRILRAMVYGTNLMYPNWNLIKDLKIPISSNEMKEKIGNIVLNAFDIMSEANLNENQAIDLIEKEIDQWQQ